jgi:hypothetical protein
MRKAGPLPKLEGISTHREGNSILITIMDESNAFKPPFVKRLNLPAEATPLDFLVAVYRDEELPIAQRLEAARTAAPFMHPKLIAIAAIAPEGDPPMRIRGGLPLLPGTQTIMPVDKVIEGEFDE